MVVLQTPYWTACWRSIQIKFSLTNSYRLSKFILKVKFIKCSSTWTSWVDITKKELEILYVLYIVIDDNNIWYYGTINSMVLKYRNVQISPCVAQWARVYLSIYETAGMDFISDNHCHLYGATNSHLPFYTGVSLWPLIIDFATIPRFPSSPPEEVAIVSQQVVTEAWRQSGRLLNARHWVTAEAARATNHDLGIY